MRHKNYRICLLSVVILAIVAGIFYYLNYVQKEITVTEGTLVRDNVGVDIHITYDENMYSSVIFYETIVLGVSYPSELSERECI